MSRPLFGFECSRGNRCWYSDLTLGPWRFMIDVGHRFNSGPWRVTFRRAR